MTDADPIAIRKSDLRREFRARRRAFLADCRPSDLALAFHILPSPLRALVAGARVIAGYAARGDEADPARLLGQMAATSPVALPAHAARDGPMEFRAWDAQAGPDGLETGPWGTLQPPRTAAVLHPDLLLVPLTAFDRRGNRLGQGGGHYDRYLAAHPGAITVGLGWAVQEADALPLAAHDCQLDYILTERAWITTGA